MSAATLAGIATAISAHLADGNDDDAILTDWFIAYGSMKHDPDVNAGGIAYGIHYATSDSSPQGALGIATLGLQQLADDLAYSDGDDD